MIISIDIEKPSDEIQHPFMIKKISTNTEEMCSNIKKAIYNKLTANTILNVEKLKAFPLRSGTSQGCPISPLLFSIVLKFQPQKAKKKNKKNPSWDRRSKTITVCK